MMLDGKRLLITGVMTRDSIAWAVADRAQRMGATVVLTTLPRTRRMTERAARGLAQPVEVLDLDINAPEDHLVLRETLAAGYGALDGTLHAIAHGAPDAIAGGFLNTSEDSALEAFKTSAFSYKTLARTVAPLMAGRPEGAALVGLDFRALPAWPIYDWMGVAKDALCAINRYVAAELGGHGIRSNLVASGPLRTVSGEGLPMLADLAAQWEQAAPAGWDYTDAGRVADVVCFLLSPLSRGMTGEVLKVDGGVTATASLAAGEHGRPTAQLDPLGVTA